MIYLQFKTELVNLSNDLRHVLWVSAGPMDIACSEVRPSNTPAIRFELFGVIGAIEPELSSALNWDILPCFSERGFFVECNELC